jgi:hypothetical protein
MNLSKTSEVVLTSSEKGLTPYWNSSCLDMSLKLLSYTKTGYVGSDTNLSKPLQPKTLAKSWFSTKVSYHHKLNLSTTYSQSSTSFRADCTDLENTAVRSKKIRIYPKNKQLARIYLGLSCWWYNRTINYLNCKVCEGDFKRIYRLCLNLDKLYSKISKAKCVQKRNLRKAAERIRWKIYDLIDDLHKKTANFLCKTFDKVFIPTFETSQMVTKLNSSVARKT